MNATLYLQFFLHGLCELAVALGVVYWISDTWETTPPSPLVRGVSHPQRFWLALALGLAVPVGAQLLRGPLIAFYNSPGLGFARVPVSYLFSVVYGTLFGLAGSCCAAPPTAGQPFSWRRAGGISAALIVATFLFSFLYQIQPWLHTAAELVVIAAVLCVAHGGFGEASAPAVPPAIPGVAPLRRKLTLPLLIGFLPAALILATMAVASSTNLGKQESDALLWLCCVVSVFCCFGASIALFTRKTGGAIAGGILLLLLNAFIAFFFGCCASLNLSNMH